MAGQSFLLRIELSAACRDRAGHNFGVNACFLRLDFLFITGLVRKSLSAPLSVYDDPASTRDRVWPKFSLAFRL